METKKPCVATNRPLEQSRRNLIALKVYVNYLVKVEFHSTEPTEKKFEPLNEVVLKQRLKETMLIRYEHLLMFCG